MPLITILVVIVIAIAGAFYYRTTQDDASATPETSEEAVSLYRDGTYTKQGTYVSPAGTEEVTISVTLEKDVVTAATFSGEATNPGSINNQQKFSQGFESQVVGRPIDTIALTVVNGSSLTPIGFTDALNQIKAEARI